MQICLDGAFLPAHQPVIHAQSPAFKWGEGLFETMRVWQGKLLSASLHFERLFAGMQLLELKLNRDDFEEAVKNNILQLCSKNSCIESARVRLAVFRNVDDSVSYLLEAVPLPDDQLLWNEEGVDIVLFSEGQKSIDKFSNIKSANYLLYRMAARFAQNSSVDDALVLNSLGAICDSSKANLFLIKDGVLSTPALKQGCVSGTMRRVVIDTAKSMNYAVNESVVREVDLLVADEVFLTNAVQVIRWVKGYGAKTYIYSHTQRIFAAVRLKLIN